MRRAIVAILLLAPLLAGGAYATAPAFAGHPDLGLVIWAWLGLLVGAQLAQADAGRRRHRTEGTDRVIAIKTRAGVSHASTIADNSLTVSKAAALLRHQRVDGMTMVNDDAIEELREALGAEAADVWHARVRREAGERRERLAREGVVAP